MADMTDIVKQAAPAVAQQGQVVAESPTVTKSLPGQIPAPKLPAQNIISGGDVTSRTKALLEAVATGGKRGLQSYQQSENAINEYRKQALGRSSALAALIGGPESQGFEQITDQQYGARLADLDQSRTVFTEDMARRGIAGKGALDQLKAIEPIIRAQVQKKIEKARAESVAAAKDKVNKDWESRALGQAELDEQTAASNVATLDKDIARLTGERDKLAKDATNREGRIGELDKRMAELRAEYAGSQRKNNAEVLFGNKVRTKRSSKEIGAEMDAVAAERHSLIKQRGAGLKEWDEKNGKTLANLTAERDKYAGINAETRDQRARTIATDQLGIDPSLATGKINIKDTAYATKPAADDATLIKKANLKDAQELSTLRNNEGYKKVQENLSDWVAGGTTKEQFLAAMRVDPMFQKEGGGFDAKLYNLIVAETAGLFPTAASLRSMNQGTE